MGKKEIILVQNQSSSLRVFLKHLKREKFSVRIAANLNNLIDLVKEKVPDILILSAKMIPGETDTFLSHLKSLVPYSNLIVTHVENHEHSVVISQAFPNARTFRSQIKFALPKELSDLLKDNQRFNVGTILFENFLYKIAME